MAYALVLNGTIEKVGALPAGARRLSDGAWITPYQRQWTDPEAASCGWLPVVDTVRPADTPTDTTDRSVQLVGGVPTVVWTTRPKTQAELDADTQGVTRTDLETKVRTAIAGNVTALGQVATATANVQAVIDTDAANITQANTQLDALATVVKNMLEQQERVMRQVTALERLLIGSDLLTDNAGT